MAWPAGAVLLLLATACGGAGGEDTAVDRGDIAFARDSLELALAEYRLAERQGGSDAATLTRLAHTYALEARVEEARSAYRRAVDQEPALVDQAAADFMHLARRAADRGDRFLMASAVDAALAFQPGISVPEMALPLARHHVRNGEFGRALPFYQRALSARPDSAPELVFEIAQAYEEIGDCQQALVFFEQFREMVEPWERGEVDWYIGHCSYQLAGDLRARIRGGPGASRSFASLEVDDAERAERALARIERTLEVGEPRNLQGRAWFEKGEILALLGDCDGALAAFEAVLDEPSASQALARRAEERFDEIRFGRGLQELGPGRPCG